MVKDFEQLMLRYLIQPEYQSQKYIQLIGAKVFEYWDYQVCYTLLSEYVDKFKVQPSITEFTQFSKNELIRKDYQDDEINDIIKIINKDLYKPLQKDEGVYVKATLIEFSQERLTASLFTDYADKLKGGAAIYKAVYKEMAEIIALGEAEVQAIQERGSLLFSEGRVHKKFGVVKMGGYDKNDIKLITMPFKGLNDVTAAGGLYSPQLAILMGGSKAFKTGILISIAVGLVRLGYKVYYADGENGLMSIQNRVIQATVECSLAELIHDTFEEGDPLEDFTPNEVFGLISKQINKYGGEFAFDSYAPKTSSIMDVEDNLLKWKEKGFVPDIILYDSIEHFIPIIPQKTDVLSSQQVITEALGLNKKWKMAAISPAQVTRDAIKKDIYSIDDMSRDFGVVKYAHAIWAINRTNDELEVGLAQLYSVVQREGKSKTVACMLQIKEERMKVKEISFEEAAKILESNIQPKTRKRKEFKNDEIDDN